jgi:hypothetical protein
VLARMSDWSRSQGCMRGGVEILGSRMGGEAAGAVVVR